MGMMRQMTARDGDTVVTWGDTKVKDATELSEAEVKERFDKIVKGAGVTAISVSSVGAPKVLKDFDAQAEEIILMPNVVAG